MQAIRQANRLHCTENDPSLGQEMEPVSLHEDPMKPLDRRPSISAHGDGMKIRLRDSRMPVRLLHQGGLLGVEGRQQVFGDQLVPCGDVCGGQPCIWCAGDPRSAEARMARRLPVLEEVAVVLDDVVDDEKGCGAMEVRSVRIHVEDGHALHRALLMIG